MKRNLSSVIMALIAILYATNVNAQQWKDYWTDYHWTNGSEMLSAVSLNKTQVVLAGNGYFDAGYGYLFEVKSLGDTNYDMKGIPESAVKVRPQHLDELIVHMLDEKYCNGDEGEVWKRREVEGHDLLISYGDDNTVRSVYVPTGREMHEVVDDDFMDIIAGSYKATNGKKFMFSNDGKCIFDGKPNTYYMSDAGENDFPTPHITLNRRIWELEPTADGMKIYETSFSDTGELLKGKLYATLIASKDAPRWKFLSDRICTQCALGQMNSDVLRVMRNEIYARKGHRFSDKSLQTYFESCKWYKPIGDNSKVKLNEIENLNVTLIKSSAN